MSSNMYSTTFQSEHTGIEHDIDIYYDYTPGCPEEGPTWDCGGVPAEGEEIEFTRVVLSDMGMKGRDISAVLTEAQVEEITEKISEYIATAEPDYVDQDWDDDRDYSRFYP